MKDARPSAWISATILLASLSIFLSSPALLILAVITATAGATLFLHRSVPKALGRRSDPKRIEQLERELLDRDETHP
ncbi:hypothetical protein ACFZAO_05295 [Streptomyces griseoaurantiacus]|uniref:hypothetical protein n=1 Tax=Streptomyces griseoaurantiacus TaxID=68213 RepID=UPI0036E5AC37